MSHCVHPKTVQCRTESVKPIARGGTWSGQAGSPRRSRGSLPRSPPA
jgi:hypothetical protein